MQIVNQIDKLGLTHKSHAAGAFPSSVLREIEKILPTSYENSLETGCGKSTILFSNLAKSHTVFCIDDRSEGSKSSIAYYEECPLTKRDRIALVLGPTQLTLPNYKEFKPLDVALIDGPHGYPFPDMEYYYLYPHIKIGGILIVDDVHIASIGRMADMIAEDEMFEFVNLFATTAIFRRTSAPLFNPFGDGWSEQHYNRRRIPANDVYRKQYRWEDDKSFPDFNDAARKAGYLSGETVLGTARGIAALFTKSIGKK
jgi:predicted O-methyltransferase YrrM